MTGFDPAEGLRGTYDSGRGAALALRERGAGTLLKTVKLWLGEPISVHFGQRGDIVMRDAYTVGVCVGPYSWFVGEAGGKAGLTTLPTASLRYAFRVPYEIEGA
ncbi:hypothetical protein [uncultured Sphingomonas sp.]|uniref:DUF6950 family protein n=1 Tax=uncultured Sphingomonas sp. TaxID=158754 RepID=UPI0025F1ECCF|nr:hypothetical protein [uncultured Sphingomonas sp.]